MTRFTCPNRKITLSVPRQLMSGLMMISLVAVFSMIGTAPAKADYVPVKPSTPETGSINGTRLIV